MSAYWSLLNGVCLWEHVVEYKLKAIDCLKTCEKANLLLMQLIKQHLRWCMHCAVPHISNPHTTISPVAVGWRVGQNCVQCCSHPSDPWANWNVCQLITITHQLLWLRAIIKDPPFSKVLRWEVFSALTCTQRLWGSNAWPMGRLVLGWRRTHHHV